MFIDINLMQISFLFHIMRLIEWIVSLNWTGIQVGKSIYIFFAQNIGEIGCLRIITNHVASFIWSPTLVGLLSTPKQGVLSDALMSVTLLHPLMLKQVITID